MTVQEAIVEFLHGWIDTGRADLPAFVEAAHKYFCETVIDGTPAAQGAQGTASKSGTGTTAGHSHPEQPTQKETAPPQHQTPGQGVSKK